MEGLVLLLLLAMGSGGRGTNGGGTGNGGGNGGGTGNGGWKGGPAGPGSIPSGDPPGGCRLVYQSPLATVQALNLLGYTPLPAIWGPDAELGTMDADPDSEVMQFQLDYNQASRSKWIGSQGGGLSPDGLMGRCTMAAMSNAQVSQGVAAWRARYMPKVDFAPATG